MVFLPYHLDVVGERNPGPNWALLGFTSLMSLLFFSAGRSSAAPFVLKDLNPAGFFGHLFVHADLLHLAGNMLFLYVFGTALCSKIGGLRFIGLYFASGLTAAVAHLILDGNPAVGASGAISGVVAACFVLFPRNEVRCILLSRWSRHHTGPIEIEAIWLIGLWVVFDIAGALLSTGNTAYWAHLGGYAGGFAAMTAMVLLKQIEFNQYDSPLFGREQVPLDGNALMRESIAQRKFTPPPRPRARPVAHMEPLRLTDEERAALSKPRRIIRQKAGN